jgi:RNA polymerase sigma factor (sigma-70 family)
MAGSPSPNPTQQAADAVDWPGLHGFVRNYVLRRTGRHDLADDIAQETVARLIDYGRTNQIATIYGLGFRIASKILLKHNRAALRMSEEEIPESHASSDPLPDHVVAARQDVALVSRILRRMPRLRREVLVRRRIKGESCATIAQDLNMSTKAVEKHITRGLRDLNEALDRRDLHE